MRLLLIIILFPFLLNAQNSVGVTGFYGFSPLPLNVVENNIAGYPISRDWNINLIFGYEDMPSSYSSLYQASLSKRINNHFLSLRYTPGYQLNFEDNTAIVVDSAIQNLRTLINYKEQFAGSYSLQILPGITTGMTLRNYTENILIENLNSIFSDSLYLIKDAIRESRNRTTIDFGINYEVNKNLNLFAGTYSLINLYSGELSPDYRKFQLGTNKKGYLGFNYNFPYFYNAGFIFETGGSFQVSSGLNFHLFHQDFFVNASLFRDAKRKKLFSGIIPSITYTRGPFTVSLSTVNYFGKNKEKPSLSSLTSDGIENIVNNLYSQDKVTLSMSLNINSVRTKKVKIVSVDSIGQVYPTLYEKYTVEPFAIIKVQNLTQEIQEVKPSIFLQNIHFKEIMSPTVKINPNETIDVPIKITIPFINKLKDEVILADFFIRTDSDEPDDRFQKPVLLNSNNGWDGRVFNLKYFVKRDFDFGFQYGKATLATFKPLFDTLNNGLGNFYKIKLLYNKAVKELTYVSDPRTSSEYVQFPSETFKVRGGDCDDLSVFFASLFETAGVETAFIDYKDKIDINHVSLLINTGLKPQEARLITNNDTKFFIRKNEYGKQQVWIPLESTILTDFDLAWETGSSKFQEEGINKLGLAKGSVRIIDIN